MISYIFKSKLKNAAVSIFSFLYLIIQIEYFYLYEFVFGYWSTGIIRFIVTLPPLFILTYMLTLKRKYRFKNLLFPAAFLILALNTLFSICQTVYSHSDITYLTVGFIVEKTLKVFVNSVVIAGYAFAFFGSINNFKKVVLLRVGAILCAVFELLTILVEGMFFAGIRNDFYDMLAQINYYNGLRKTFIIMLFYVSIFILTLGKKGEYIDITPFIEERKAKKEAKKAEKLKREAGLEAIPQKTSDGYWRCMGCGKLLPDSENKCDCGYKR